MNKRRLALLAAGAAVGLLHCGDPRGSAAPPPPEPPPATPAEPAASAEALEGLPLVFSAARPAASAAARPAASGPKAPPRASGDYPALPPIPPHAARCPDPGNAGPNSAGMISMDPIKTEIRSHVAQFRTCFEVGLEHNPELSGGISTRFRITPKGSVCGVENGGSQLPDPWVVECVNRVFYSMSFPAPIRMLTITYPLTFTAAD